MDKCGKMYHYMSLNSGEIRPGTELVPVNSLFQYYPEFTQCDQSYRVEAIEYGKGYERWNAQIVYLKMPIEDSIQQEYWVDQLAPFVGGMSNDDFRLRYGIAKPDDPSEIRTHTRKVLGFEKTDHETLIVFQSGEVIAAASLFDPNQHGLSSTGEYTGVTEMSITIAKEHQGTGLARALIETAAEEAKLNGKTHLYLSFVEGNNRSKAIFWHILGGENIVAGRTNPLEMCCRLVGSFKDYEKLERYMVSKMGKGWENLPEEQVAEEILAASGVSGFINWAQGFRKQCNRFYNQSSFII